jgi:Cu/Ag efflux protein CusF
MIKKATMLIIIPAAMLFLALTSSYLLAQGHDHGSHGMHGMGAAPDQTTASPPAGTSSVLVSRGVVKQLDRNAGTVVLDHEAIPALNWESMVMEFQVDDPALLDDVKAGDAVRFDLKVTGMGPNGSFVITDLEVE